MFLRIAVLSLVIQLVGREETSRILEYDKLGLKACVANHHTRMKGGQGHACRSFAMMQECDFSDTALSTL